MSQNGTGTGTGTTGHDDDNNTTIIECYEHTYDHREAKSNNNITETIIYKNHWLDVNTTAKFPTDKTYTKIRTAGAQDNLCAETIDGQIDDGNNAGGVIITYGEREYGKDTRAISALLHSCAKAMNSNGVGTIWAGESLCWIGSVRPELSLSE